VKAGFLSIFLTLLSLFGCSIYHSQPGAGDAARDFLTSATYTQLKIEIQFVSGYAPTAGAQTQLVSWLQNYLNKPGGITITVDSAINPLNSSPYSLTEILNIENTHRIHHSFGSEAVAYFLFVNGNSDEDSGSNKILGYAYGPTSMVIFQNTIQSLSGGFGQPTRQVLETTVMEHEFGHILGLVNTGTPLQSAHQDSAHGAHCSNNSCLMFWQSDTSGILGNLLGGVVPTLDTDCENDLHANGGL
jgi:hypothetical protein